MAQLFKIKSRFYINNPLQMNQSLNLDKSISHHLMTVLRAKPAEYIRVFNAVDGEFNAEIIQINKQQVTIKILNQYKSYTKPKQHLHLAFAPLKKDANNFILEKATELGVNEISYIITERTVNKINLSKSITNLTQATQQCGRLDIPKINSACSLSNFLSHHQDIFWLNENKLGTTLSQQLKLTLVQNPIFLIGPEGGFSPNEYQLLQNTNNLYAVYLNHNILRAETACLTVLAIYQNMVGNL